MKASKLKNTTIFTLLLLTLPLAHAGDWSGNVSGYLGQKSLDDDDWQELDKQAGLGVIFDLKHKNWPVSIALDIIASGDEHESGTQKNTGFTVEHHIGIRKIFALPDYSLKPYIGGGVSIALADIENKNGSTVINDEEDRGVGTWVGVGTYYELTPHFNIGVDVRYSKAEVTLINIDREVGGLYTGVTAGYHW